MLERLKSPNKPPRHNDKGSEEEASAAAAAGDASRSLLQRVGTPQFPSQFSPRLSPLVAGPPSGDTAYDSKRSTPYNTGRSGPRSDGPAGREFKLERSAVQRSRGNKIWNLDEYVEAHGGTHAIRKILIANNGIAAVKSIRSMRSWAYSVFGETDAIKFVAMATPEDIKANAQYIHLADEFISVPGGSNNNNYANCALIVDVAERVGADAVWAGWGHASENPRLPEMLARANIIWIGPSPDAMRALGDKIGSTLIAQSAGVPCIPWSGSGITVNYAESGIPKELYEQSCVKTLEEAQKICADIGFPIMIKASEGGGGKGIRKCINPAEVELAFQQVQGEVPGSPIFIMKLSSNARHLEVQLLADTSGNAIAVFGRDCSVQRRHQKIIEEGPVLAAPPKTWREMEQAAVRLAKEVGYVNCGTVEYLFTDSGEFYFLELNPRLQVEHPVTEIISGTNLPACQLQVAMGIPLNRIGCIRQMYGEDYNGTSVIDFDNTPAVLLPKHVIACRITAENPDKAFQPTSGDISELKFRDSPNVWGYFSVAAKSSIHEFSDSQFGHVFAHGPTREHARQNMVVALSELVIRGQIRTTVEFLRSLIESADFKANRITTTWLETVMDSIVTVKPPRHVIVCLGALFRAVKISEAALLDFGACLERSQMPSQQLHSSLTTVDTELIYEGDKYLMKITKSGPTQYDIHINGWTSSAEVHPLSDGGIVVLLENSKHVVYGQEFTSGLRLTIDGKTCLFEKEYDPTTLRSAMQGKLVRYLVEDNTHVNKNEPYAEVEVMKMYVTLNAPEDGMITLGKTEGAILEAGDVIAKLILDDPDTVQKAELFTGLFPELPKPILGHKTHLHFRHSIQKLEMLLSGYELAPSVMESAFETVMQCLRDPHLPLYQFKEIISTLVGRIPEQLSEDFQNIAAQYSDKLRGNRFYWESPEAFPVFAIEDAIQRVQMGMEATELKTLGAALSLAGINHLVSRYRNGNHTYAILVLTSLMEEFVQVEEHFNLQSTDGLVKTLRDRYNNDYEVVATLIRAHHQLKSRSALILKALDTIGKQMTPLLSNFKDILRRLTRLYGDEYATVVLRVRQLLTSMELPSVEKRIISVNTLLKAAAAAEDDDKSVRLAPLIDLSQPIEDIIFDAFSREKSARLRTTAMEVYIRRVYQVYRILDINVKCNDDATLFGVWHFTLPIEGQSSVSGGGSRALELMEDTRLNTITKSDSVYNLAAMGKRSPSSPSRSVNQPRDSPDYLSLSNANFSRMGGFAYFHSFDQAKDGLDELVSKYDPGEFKEPVHVLYVSFPWTATATLPEDDQIVQVLDTFLAGKKKLLEKHAIRRLTFIISHGDETPVYLSFRHKHAYHEDPIVRHIEPFYAQYMQIHRLSNYNIQYKTTTNRAIHLFEARPKIEAKVRKGAYDGRRLFARVLLRRMENKGETDSKDLDAHPEAEYTFVEALNAIEMAIGSEPMCWRFNSIFINVLVATENTVGYIEALIRLLARRYATKIKRCFVSQVELMVGIVDPVDGSVTPYRFLCTNDTGFVLNVVVFKEVIDEAKQCRVFEQVYSSQQEGPHFEFDPTWNQKPTTFPYEPLTPAQWRRIRAERTGTVYCYDMIPIMERGVQKTWHRHIYGPHPTKPQSSLTHSDITTDNNALEQRSYQFARDDDKLRTEGVLPSRFLDLVELVVLDWTNPVLSEVSRRPGMNDIGMVAWKITLYTVEYPQGRDIVIISNDITFQAGSFGPKEDLLFGLASMYARERGIPRIYWAANSGARIGLADEIKPKFKVGWVNQLNNSFEYLYLSEADYKELSHSVECERLQLDDGEVRYVLSAIVGEKDGLGVENLRGSGWIAGETSLAYEQIFTLTYITARSVGIGAYLARLGQRCIQKKSQPILLTGFSALNKLLGKPVYSSNNQLGGPDIMYTNGVSHLVVDNDMEGMMETLRWLSFVPARRGETAARLLPPKSLVNSALDAPIDPIDRPVATMPSTQPYDPRVLLAGHTDADGKWSGGFFDRDSWTELMGGWARGVVCGRARLGGYPMGVIAVETNTIEQINPADPARNDAKEQVNQRAGSVWYPDSAFKTATAITDMICEDLPLMIFANWRGFSGGMRDMFDEVLKFGSMIVDALSHYRQPVFIYLPPHSTLRGGAWVVVDPTINEQHMEMYADHRARGGVLECEGTVNVKYRKADVIKTAHRLDPQLKQLDVKLAELNDDDGKNAHAINSLKQEISDREAAVYPIYLQIALNFADLHDRTGRLVAKGVVKKAVAWEESRKFFFWRMRRRVLELKVSKKICQVLESGKASQNQDVATANSYSETKQVSSSSSSSDDTGSLKKADSRQNWLLIHSMGTSAGGKASWREASELLQSWLIDLAAPVQEDQALVAWLEEEKNQTLLSQKMAELNNQILAKAIKAQATTHPDGVVAALSSVINSLSADDLAALKAQLA